MKCKTNEQIQKEREEAVKELKNQGHEVIDTIFDIPDGTPLQYLSESINAMNNVDCVVFMPGWEKARGCRTEYIIAQEYGKFIKFLNE